MKSKKYMTNKTRNIKIHLYWFNEMVNTSTVLIYFEWTLQSSSGLIGKTVDVKGPGLLAILLFEFLT